MNVTAMNNKLFTQRSETINQPFKYWARKEFTHIRNTQTNKC